MPALDPAFVPTLAFALSAGVATFFAPCAFPLLPGYVGYYLSQEESDLSGAAVRGLAATLGALVVLGAVAGVILAVGQGFVHAVTLLEPVIGLLLVALGVLILAGRSPSLHLALPERRATVGGFGLFGAVYALAAAGCVIPVVLGVVSQSLTLPPEQAAVVLGSYAGAVALPLGGVTLMVAAGDDSIRKLGSRVGSVQRLAAVVMILAGVWQVVRSLSFLGYL